MSAVTVCPKCSRIVSLPAGEDRSVWVHCPLCHSQYPLQAALDYVPPALAIIPAPMSDAGVAAGSAALASGMFHPGETHANEHGEAVATQHPELGHSDIALGGTDFGGMDLGGMAPMEHAEFSQGTAEHGTPNEASIDHAVADHGVAEHAGVERDFADPEFAPHDSELHAAEAHGMEHEAAMFGAADHALAEHAAGEHGALEDGAVDDVGFRFSDELHHEGETGEHAVDESGVEGHQLGSIATMVQTAPPKRTKRKPPMMVRVIGALIGIAFSALGLIIVYSVFLFFGQDTFGIGHYWPAFINRTGHNAPSTTANPAKPSKAPVTSNAQPTPGSPLPNPNGFQTPPDANSTNPAAQPNPADLAQNTNPPATTKTPPEKGEGDLTRTEDPLNTAPSDTPPKTDLTKVDPLGTAPPKIDLPAEPPKLPTGDNATKTPEKPVNHTGTKTPDVAPEKPPLNPTDKPSVPTDKPVVPSAKAPSENLPSNNPPVKNPNDKPLVPTDKPPTDKPVEPAKVEPVKPDSTVGLKAPATVQMADVDAAAKEVRTARDAYMAAEATKDPVSEKRPRILYYRAMSHLATVLAGRLDEAGPNAAADRGKMDALADELLTGPSAATAAAEHDDFSMLSMKWIASPSRKESGVFLIGKLVKTQPAGRVFVSQVQLPGADSELSVVTPTDPIAAGAVKTGENVIVLGALVDEPAQRLNGYEGNAVQVVWAVKVDPAPLAPATSAGGKGDDSVGAKSAPEKAPK